MPGKGVRHGDGHPGSRAPRRGGPKVERGRALRGGRSGCRPREGSPGEDCSERSWASGQRMSSSNFTRSATCSGASPTAERTARTDGGAAARALELASSKEAPRARTRATKASWCAKIFAALMPFRSEPLHGDLPEGGGERGKGGHALLRMPETHVEDPGTRLQAETGSRVEAGALLRPSQSPRARNHLSSR